MAAALPVFGEKTALIVVDVQNDFAHPDGSLYVDGGDHVVPVVNRLIAAARDAGALVAYTQDWHPPVTPHFRDHGGTWPAHCVRETWGADFHRALEVVGPVVRKGTAGEDGYSGFTARDVGTGEETPTGLDALLREHGTRQVVVVGLAQDVCVKETALDARRLRYETWVPLDATRPVDVQPGDGQAAIEAMAAAGVNLIAPDVDGGNGRTIPLTQREPT